METRKKLDFNYIPSKKTKKTIVAFHGWQGNKDSFLPVAKHSLFSKYNWFLLQGPYMVNNNTNRRSWSYEISPNKFEQQEPKNLINTFFNDEVFPRFKSKDIYIIGFSLGALVCYEFICSMKQQLGAIFPISGFIRSNDINLNPNQIKTPIVIGHGKNDNIVPYEKSLETYKILKKKNANVELITYKGHHNISIEMLKIISKTIDAKA